MRKVVIINDFASVNGGAAKVAIETLTGLKAYDIDCYFISATGNVSEINSILPHDKIIFTNQPEALNNKSIFKGILQTFYNYKAKKATEVLLRKLNNDNTIVHVHGWIKSLSIAPITVALKMNFKVVITLHDYFIACPNGGFYNFQDNSICTKKPLSLNCIKTDCDSRKYSFKLFRVLRTFYQKKIFLKYKKNISVITISNLSRQILFPYIKDFRNVFFLENSIDTKKVNRVNIEKNIIPLFIGRLSPEKGIRLFCNAISELKIEKSVVIGDGIMLDKLKKEYIKINFYGWKNSIFIKNFFTKTRFLVFPSIWYETYGLVIQEAASYGIPSIVSDCCAGKDLIIDNQSGLLFKSNDVNDLCKKIKLLTENEDLLIKLGLTCYNEFWSKSHSRNNYSIELLKIYDDIINS